MDLVARERLPASKGTVALAVVFGLASVPWTYAFVAGLELPLWPSFVASATYFAADAAADDAAAARREALVRAVASNASGIAYAAATILLVEAALGGGALALSLAVGLAMFLASLNEHLPGLSFTPGAFFGYAATFGVHAADATAFGIGGLPGTVLAVGVGMPVGAAIGLAADAASDALAA